MSATSSAHKPASISLHRQINNLLTGTVILLALYIILAPFTPQLGWWLNSRQAMNSAEIQARSAVLSHAPVPQENLLLIPRLNMREAIRSGPSVAELSKGVWLIPNASRPDQQGNTVIVGHRFTYAGPAVFYFLDKIQLNDQIKISWQGREYTYKVASIKVVPPDDLSVEQPTDKPRLTLYTCTPLWSAKNRLVIVAPLTGVRS